LEVFFLFCSLLAPQPQSDLTPFWNFLNPKQFGKSPTPFQDLMIPENIPILSKAFSVHPAASWLAGIIACISLVGCRQRAYTELYVENMASEIRVLEDRVYEYDAAYQTLERENEEQRRINASLETKLRELKAEPESTQSSNKNRLKTPPKMRTKPEPYSLPGESILEDVVPPNATKNSSPSKMESILELSPEPEMVEMPPAVSRTPAAPPSQSPAAKPLEPVSPPSLELPAPADANTTKNPVKEAPVLPFPDPQALDLRKGRKNKIPAIADDQLVEQVDMPKTLLTGQGSAKPSTIAIPVGTSQSKTPSSNLIAPPTPEILVPNNPNSENTSKPPALLPPAMSHLQGNPQGRVQPGKIRMPEGSAVQWASANVPVEPTAQETILDKKIVDIAFHPTMCRGHNFDTNPGDDGLYLVVTPLNEAGQVINQLGSLTVIVEEDGLETKDGANNESHARIAGWEITKEELQESLNPIGSAQGFHLSLPWKEASPKGQIVTVYLKYELEDGHVFVNQRNIQLRKPSKGQSVWSPR
jgi:hypothetical protein